MQVSTIISQALEQEAHPFKVTGLLHDLGKLLLLFGSEGQWDVVGVSQKDQSLFNPPTNL